MFQCKKIMGNYIDLCLILTGFSLLDSDSDSSELSSYSSICTDSEEFVFKLDFAESCEQAYNYFLCTICK